MGFLKSHLLFNNWSFGAKRSGEWSDASFSQVNQVAIWEFEERLLTRRGFANCSLIRIIFAKSALNCAKQRWLWWCILLANYARFSLTFYLAAAELQPNAKNPGFFIRRKVSKCDQKQTFEEERRDFARVLVEDRFFSSVAISTFNCTLQRFS